MSNPQTTYPCEDGPPEKHCAYRRGKIDFGDFMGHTCKKKEVPKPSQEYLLVCLMEELAEVAQVASKIYRFGQNDWKPGTSEAAKNSFQLSAELGDLYGIIDMLEKSGIKMDYGAIDRYRSAKKAKILEFMGRERKP